MKSIMASWTREIAYVIILIVTGFLKTAECQQGEGHGLGIREPYVPVQSIPGTNLYTGIFYKLKLQKFPSAWVTWTSQKNDFGQWHYVQVDNDPEHALAYEKHGQWHKDIQWFFIPSEVTGYYLLRNRGVLGEAIATWSRVEKTQESGHYIILDPNPASHPREDSLWKPVPVDSDSGKPQGNAYQLKIHSVPDGVTTWTEETYGKHSHYIQVSSSGLSSNRLQEDTIFLFEEIESELTGDIRQIELHLFPWLDELRHLTQTDCDNEHVPSSVFHNVGSTPIRRQVKQDIAGKGELTLKLAEQLATNFLKINQSSSGQISPPWYSEEVDFYLLGSDSRSGEIKLATLEKSVVNTEVTIPPWTTTEIRVCHEYIDTFSLKDVKIDAAVFMDVTEKTFRPDGKTFEAVFASLPSKFPMRKLDEIIHGLEETSIDPRWQLRPKYTEGSSFEEANVPIMTVLGARESEVVVVAPANVKGRFGYRGIIASN